MNPIVLASQSPRRKQLLEWAEVPFDIIVKGTDESYPDGLRLEEIPVHIARNKALAVQQSELYKRYDKGNIILAADTIVELEGIIMGKPEDAKEAIKMLMELSGKTHRVITGVCILKHTDEFSFADVTEVEFHNITPGEITYSVEQYQPFDKAGAYAIQEWIGVTGIKKINGDFYNVMGLPVSRVVQKLAAIR